ncbi:MAG TPA: AzlC family ABC transporter permease [Polaromonas sp.]|uniref:AzlC family ABC transporter permease n=1 Tax=Polaromonas sp. TaxID=1869339 RepID=UPI002D524DB1|nr:AzlC family ABC transporter permease [Polaromonas sp.]HYW58008.1 AzlC family ABC transporter permease [Polaromonas sp.]
MEASFTAAGVRRGFVVGQPMAPGVLLYGMVFGVLASERGLSALQAIMMSAFVYSGSAQLAALQGWTSSGLILPLIATILVMNARYVLYSAAIQPWLRHSTRAQALGSLFFLGDGNWALSMREYDAGYRDAGFILGSGVAMFAPWVLGTLAGHLLARSVPDPAAFGLDFMLVAFAAAIGMAMWRGKSDLWPAAAAALTALVLHRLLPGGWYIVGAGLAGGLMGAWRHGR